MAFTLADAHEAGWTGEEAKKFTAWMNEVRTGFSRKMYGFEPDDLLGDWHYAASFEAGMSPENAVTGLINECEAEGFSRELLMEEGF